MKTSIKIILPQLAVFLLFIIPAFADIENTNDTQDGAETISAGHIVNGTLHTSFPEKGTDNDYYKFTTYEDGYIILDIAYSDISHINLIQIYDNVTNPGRFFAASGGPYGTPIYTHYVGAGVEPGTHYFLIGSTYLNNYMSDATYSFTITFVPTTEKNDLELNNDYTSALFLQLNKKVTGHVDYPLNDSTHNVDVNDWYYLNVPTEGDLSITCKNTPIDVDPGCQTILMNLFDSVSYNRYDVEGGYPEAKINRIHLLPGKYTVQIRGDGGCDDGFGYTLSDTFFINSLPSVTIANKSILEGDTGTTQLKFPITLSNAYTDTVKIKYKTKNSTATAGSDYIAKQGTLIFNPRETKKNIIVTIKGDTQHEANEKLFVLLSQPYNAVIAKDTAIGTIRNDDNTGLMENNVEQEPQIAVTQHSLSIFPNPAKSKFTVSLSAGEYIGSSGTIEVLNMLGQIIHKETVVLQSKQKDILLPSGTPTGVYSVLLKANNKTFHTKLIYQP